MYRTLLVLACVLSQAFAGVPLVLHDGTPVRLRLSRNLSSADAKVGETVDFQVLDEVKVGDVVVIARGGTALATVTEAQAKRRMARGGKLNVNVDHVRLANNEKAALRAIKETKGGGHTGAMTGAMVATGIVFFPAAPLFLFMHGKDITIPKGTEITAYVNGDVKLDAERFRPMDQGTPAATAATPAPTIASAATQSSVSIASTPPGADIAINGRFAGSTPSTLRVNPGNYRIAVTKSGFKAWAREVEVGPGASITINAELEQSAAY
jgi:hypothetical protein